MPCARGRRREGDLGNFAGDTFVAALDMLTDHVDTGWASLVGSSCAVWNKAARTCDAFPVGCNSNGDALEAVGVLALSDDALSREFVLGADVAQRRVGGGAAGAGDLDYDCLGDTTVEATIRRAAPIRIFGILGVSKSFQVLARSESYLQ